MEKQENHQWLDIFLMKISHTWRTYQDRRFRASFF